MEKQTNKIPKYINCKNKKTEYCEYFMTTPCHKSCAYARDFENREIGIGAVTDGGLYKRLDKKWINQY